MTHDTAALVAETREQIAALHEWRDDECEHEWKVYTPWYQQCVKCGAESAGEPTSTPQQERAVAIDAEPPLERLRRLCGDCDTLDLWRDAGFEVPVGGEKA